MMGRKRPEARKTFEKSIQGLPIDLETPVDRHPRIPKTFNWKGHTIDAYSY